ncbi:hypothetical protein E3N88_22863 [Mikania micrantha]|uniref:Uncharacterized protein n=1 Tax=Mikania micrantha TaxID=192012 RepID=A0A5N6NBP1_9ASTR|nr:hypothetical protein E3N88_22863 [Mikania micrantha]
MVKTGRHAHYGPSWPYQPSFGLVWSRRAVMPITGRLGKRFFLTFIRFSVFSAYTFITEMDAEMLQQEQVAQQMPPLDPESLALSQHAWLQFEEHSATFMRCRRIFRMSVPTPWTRLFDLADLPTYRLITVEFLSTFRYRAHQAAVREADDEELPSDIEFSLCGQHFEMSIERFAVYLGIYYEPETVHDDFAQAPTQGEEGVMRAWWSQR